ncbi:MAG: hypothetical protein JW795_13410, partial [Chitinivibrionales bacterium]|nr:hypothetical protein [Chitinivibrionales bacterium]
DASGKKQPLVATSSNIAVERILACFIEQNHDNNGIVWNKSLSPFAIHLIAVNMGKELVSSTAENVYKDFCDQGYDVLFDDRVQAQAGFKFNDADLIGVPVQVILGEKNLKVGLVEVKTRQNQQKLTVRMDELSEKVSQLCTQPS